MTARSNAHQVRVHRVMDHIRQNLDGDLGLEALSKVACYSPYHFHRLFTASTGETLTAYVQRARLERAAYLMKASPKRSLLAIALEAGFSEHSDFSRLFKKRYGVSPSKWDRRSRLDDSGLLDGQAIRMAVETSNVEARIVQHPACRLAYVRIRTPFIGDALRIGYEALCAELERLDFDWRAAPLIGMSWDHYETTPIEDVRFDFGFGVPAQVVSNDVFNVYEIPAVTSVDVHCRGPLRTIAMAWTYLYDTWLPNSDYEPIDLPGMKRFRQRPDELGWSEWDLDCSIVVRRLEPQDRSSESSS